MKQIGKYKVIKELGVGGMGRVYKVRDTETSKAYALKVLKASPDNEKKDLERFIREVKLTAQLKHPHIVKLYDVGAQNNSPYFVMDYINGASLKELIKENLSPKAIARYFLPILNAISYAHEKGIVHRDLKPANIMINKKGKPIVMDFGLAKSASSETLTASGMIMGSINYMPPEQAEGLRREIDETSDVYSLGAILYEMLTQERPFEGKNLMEVQAKIFHQPPKKPRSIKSNIPKPIESICLKALEKQKQNRYQSAKAMAIDIKRFLEGKKVSASSSFDLRPLQSWLSNHQGIIVFYGIVIIALLMIWWLK